VPRAQPPPHQKDRAQTASRDKTAHRCPVVTELRVTNWRSSMATTRMRDAPHTHTTQHCRQQQHTHPHSDASFSDATVITHGMARPARGGGTCQTYQKACYEYSAAHCCCCCCWWWWCRWMASLWRLLGCAPKRCVCVSSETSPRSRVSVSQSVSVY
jgi:hypothetical protein